MAPEQSNGGVATNGTPDFTVKAGLAQMLKGGVIMDVVNAEQVSPSSPRLLFINNVINVYRPASLKKPALQLSWPSNVSPPISELKVALLACPIPL
jgi:hypothetical protein